MSRIKIMINGIPGKVAVNLFQHALNDNRFELLNYSLTGPEISIKEYTIESKVIKLIKPDEKQKKIKQIIKNNKNYISIDFTHPSAVIENAGFYCDNKLPFVMGTTGGDRDKLEKIVSSSKVSAVIAPNMAKQIVAFQAMIKYAADNFPGVFNGYSMEILESHQKSKADVSGTAKAMLVYFQKMGISVDEKNIFKERNPDIQKERLGVPEQHLDGHAWHTYAISSEDDTSFFQFTHNINGRDIYSLGTLDAVYFLSKRIKDKKLYNMLDVLKG